MPEPHDPSPESRSPVPTQQVPGLYHRRIGDITVTTVSDGYYDTPVTAYRGLPQDEVASRFAAAFQRVPPRVAINTFLIQSGGRTALVDTGAGESMGPTLGHQLRTLSVLGIAPQDIDTVLLTHLHPDHSNGLTDGEGRALFPKAELVVSQHDVRFRGDDAARARFGEVEQRRYFDHPRVQIAPYAERMRDAVGEVFPGVSVVPLPGHTPGHTGYRIASGGEALLIWGDICHAQELQLANPEVTVGFDIDPVQAVETRRQTLEEAAIDRLLVAGMHVHFPGLIHIVRSGNGYAAIPEPWSYNLR